ncbi:hypothetical protein PU345_004319 [Enterobacter kobei]|nr:hypothetical protein [Enterobacter kobei]
MKNNLFKSTLCALLVASTTSSFSALAAVQGPTTDMTITGELVAGSCSLDLTNNNITIPDISYSAYNAAGRGTLGVPIYSGSPFEGGQNIAPIYTSRPADIGMSITCPAATYIAYTSVSNSGMGPISGSGYNTETVLLDDNGVAIGDVSISNAGYLNGEVNDTTIIDGVQGHTVYSADSGNTWRKSVSFNGDSISGQAGTRWYSFTNDSDATTPSPVTTVTKTFNIYNSYLAPDLTTTSEVNFAGSITVELLYL